MEAKDSATNQLRSCANRLFDACQCGRELPDRTVVSCLQSQQIADIFDDAVEFDGAGRVGLLIGCECVLSLWKDRVLIQFRRLVCRHGLLPQVKNAGIKLLLKLIDSRVSGRVLPCLLYTSPSPRD